MAGRIRTIKPEILSDSKAARLSDAAWRLWVSTWVMADDEGCFPADPVWLSGQVFWARPQDCEPLLAELVSSGLIRTYVVNEEKFAALSGWKKHQKINRPSSWRFPSESGLSDGSLSNHERLMRRPPTTTTTTTTTTTIDLSPRADARECDFDFETVFALYPRPEGKSASLRRARREVTTTADFEALKSAIGNYAERCKAERREIRYVLKLSSFMNEWRDHVEAPKGAYSAPKGAAAKSNWREPMQHRAETKDETDDL